MIDLYLIGSCFKIFPMPSLSIEDDETRRTHRAKKPVSFLTRTPYRRKPPAERTDPIDRAGQTSENLPVKVTIHRSPISLKQVRRPFFTGILGKL